MFLPIAFESKNCVADMQAGLYGCTCSAYQSPKDVLKAFMFEYVPANGDAIVACDLLIVDGDESLFFRDFMLMPDRTWRDSYGARAAALEGLLPPEILEYKLIERFTLPSQQVGN